MIKVLASLGLLVVIVTAFRHRNTARNRAWKKIAAVLFVVIALLSIFFPTVSDRIAHTVGVGRGADLILYMLLLAFMFISVNTYLKFRDYDDQITTLARRLAIEEAVRRYGVEDKDIAPRSATPPPEGPDRPAD